MITKDSNIFNIAKTTIIKSIKTILEILNTKKVKFKFKKSNFIVKKQKVQQLSVKHIISN